MPRAPEAGRLGIRELMRGGGEAGHADSGDELAARAAYCTYCGEVSARYAGVELTEAQIAEAWAQANAHDRVCAKNPLAREAARYRALRQFLHVDFTDGEQWGLWCLAEQDETREDITAIHARDLTSEEEECAFDGVEQPGPGVDEMLDELVRDGP